MSIAGRDVSVESSTFIGNTANHGGGLAFWGRGTVRDSNFSGNSSTVEGGGIWASSDLAIHDTLIANNASGVHGGGIYSLEDPELEISLTLENSEVVGNTADERGGGLYVRRVSATNLVLADNASGDSGGGAYLL